MPRGTDDASDYGSVGAATPIDEEHLPLLPGKLRRRTTRAA